MGRVSNLRRGNGPLLNRISDRYNGLLLDSSLYRFYGRGQLAFLKVHSLDFPAMGSVDNHFLKDA
jgi:hypothetical protein